MVKRRSEYHIIIEALKYYQTPFSPCTYTYRTCKDLIKYYKEQEEKDNGV